METTFADTNQIFEINQLTINELAMELVILLMLIATIAEGKENFSNFSETFTKCCPYNQRLRYTDGDYEKYDCVDYDTSENRDNVSVIPLVSGYSGSVRFGIPACDEIQMIEVNDDAAVYRNSCYDRLELEMINGTLKENNRQVVALNCASDESADILELAINRLQKCCRNGQSYDTVNHLCRDGSERSTAEELVHLLSPESRDVYEVNHDLQCKAGEYAMEYEQRAHNFKLEGSSLRLLRLESGRESVFMRGEWCAERSFRNEGLVVRGCSRDCAATGGLCLMKCCPVGYHYHPRRCTSLASDCVPNTSDVVTYNYSKYLDPEFLEGRTLGISSNFFCPRRKYALNEKIDGRFYINQEGLMVQEAPHVQGEPTSSYCIESFDYRHCDKDIEVNIMACLMEANINTSNRDGFKASVVTNCLSCVFLVLTLTVYCALPELHNLHGKTLICHVSTMLLAFCCLARVQSDYVSDPNMCKALGYGIYFGFMSAFCWLNVMCLDIWWTFGSVRSVQPLRKAGADRRRFIWYSIYAWSLSILLTVTTLLLDLYPVSSYLDSNMGDQVCWFQAAQNGPSDWPHYIFFVIPMGIMTLTNFVLWIRTAWHCNKVKSEVHRLQAGSVGDRAKKRFRADRARYLLTGKLWVVMGAGWATELIATVAVEHVTWLWTIIDTINELQGVSIFLILVLKPKIYYLIRKKLGIDKETGQKNGSSSNARTSSTFLSRSISADEKTNLRASVPPPELTSSKVK